MAVTSMGEEGDPTSRYQNPRYSGKGVPDRGDDPSRKSTSPDWSKMKATCGHEDPMGYFGNTVCKSCARKGYKKAMGR